MDILSTDQFSMDVVDSMRTVLDQIALPPPVVKFPGDIASEDSPLRVWLTSSAQYSKFAASPNFRQLQASTSTMARASQMKTHPFSAYLSRGDAGLWNGFLLLKLPHLIRFYASNPVKYCADASSNVESTANVPDSFGNNFAIDRSIILGGQAAAEAFAASEHSGIPFFWKE
jgi:hypothetical protein